ncbi:MAG: thioredoxin family protein [Bacteroidetes bacterium]|nr:thioredoxin family protein [Bacteroidota bacterium]
MLAELTTDNLSEYISDNQTVLVQFSAGWCGNCRVMKPKFKKLAEQYPDASFVIVDAEKFPESRKLAQVDNLPTFAAFRNGSFANQLQTNKFELLKDFVHEAAHH